LDLPELEKLSTDTLGIKIDLEALHGRSSRKVNNMKGSSEDSNKCPRILRRPIPSPSQLTA
jgi:hypothetical protein